MPKKVVRLTKERITPVKSWWPRFWAWAIDSLILGVVFFIFIEKGDLLTPTTLSNSFAGSFIGFIYWAVTESDGRQSIGMKTMKLKLVKVTGEPANLGSSATSAFGKAFLLPLDFIIGVLARPGKKQRLFNIISDTIVVKE